MTPTSNLDKHTRRPKRLLQNHDTFVQWVQYALNIGAVAAPLLVLTYWRDGVFGEQYRVMLVFAVLLMTITYHLMGVFRRFETLVGGLQLLARAWGAVIILLAWLAFLTKTSEEYSRQVIVYWAMASYGAQVVLLYFTRHIHTLYRRRYKPRFASIIIGTGSLSARLARSINGNIWLSDKLIGVVSLEQSASAEDWSSKDEPIIGSDADLKDVIEKHNVRRVYMALPLSETHKIESLQNSLEHLNVDIVWAPDIYSLKLLNHSVREVSGIPLINLNETPLRNGGPAFIKSFMDKSIAVMAILALSPILITIALLVKLTSKGPIIFKQVRDGWDGKKFHVYKFRSMYVHEAKEVVEQAKANDSRITPVGGFIRRTSIDELPQLFNVLNGSMSLVGPRPHAESHNLYYQTKVITYLARHRIKPGITGLAQINGLRGETANIEDMKKRVELDLEYIRNWSPMLDLKILFATPMRLISKRGNAY